MHPSFFIIHLTDFSTLSELKYEKARMHNVHPGFFILQLTESAEIIELGDEKDRMHMVHPSFFILQLTESAESSELQGEQGRAYTPLGESRLGVFGDVPDFGGNLAVPGHAFVAVRFSSKSCSYSSI